jgi:hypothetical protein
VESTPQRETMRTDLGVQPLLWRSGASLFLFVVFEFSQLNLVMGAPPYAAEVAMASGVAFFLSVLAIGRWLVKHGAPRTGIGCIGSTFLVVAGMSIAIVSTYAWYRMDILACGLIGWFVCFCALIPRLVATTAGVIQAQPAIHNEENRPFEGDNQSHHA